MNTFNDMSYSEIAEVLLKETFRNPSTNCLEWVGSVAKGRPMIWINDRLVSARRVVYVGFHPEQDIPDRDQIKTTCKCLRCINPDHLFRASLGRVKPEFLRPDVEDDDDMEGPDVLTKMMTPEFKKSLAEQTVNRAMTMIRSNPLAMATMAWGSA